MRLLLWGLLCRGLVCATRTAPVGVCACVHSVVTLQGTGTRRHWNSPRGLSWPLVPAPRATHFRMSCVVCPGALPLLRFLVLFPCPSLAVLVFLLCKPRKDVSSFLKDSFEEMILIFICISVVAWGAVL